VNHNLSSLLLVDSTSPLLKELPEGIFESSPSSLRTQSFSTLKELLFLSPPLTGMLIFSLVKRSRSVPFVHPLPPPPLFFLFPGPALGTKSPRKDSGISIRSLPFFAPLFFSLGPHNQRTCPVVFLLIPSLSRNRSS